MTEAARRLSHQAALYESPTEAATMLHAFVADGLTKGVPTILVVGPDLDRALADVLGDAHTDTIRLSLDTYRRPLASLERELELDRRLLERGAAEVRMVAAVPHPGTGAEWSGWLRFEAAANHFLADLPVSRVCAYDLRSAPRHVVDDVYATHPLLLERDGSARLNPDYVAPETLIPKREAQEVDSIEESQPVVELHDPSVDEATDAVAGVAVTVPLPRQDVSALCLAADEAITNARRHGQGTVTTRIWRGPNRVAVAVSDEGEGPSSPFVGMVNGSASRQGMWLLHQLCTRVNTTRDQDGFTVHLVAEANVPRRG